MDGKEMEMGRSMGMMDEWWLCVVCLHTVLYNMCVSVCAYVRECVSMMPMGE